MLTLQQVSRIRQDVQCGADWLDEELSGWEDLIDCKSLNVGCGTTCILTQLKSTKPNISFGARVVGLCNSFHLDEGIVPIRHTTLGIRTRNYGWDLMTILWKREILARRNVRLGNDAY